MKGTSHDGHRTDRRLKAPDHHPIRERTVGPRRGRHDATA